MKKAKEFKEIILKQFKDTSKTGWRKNEIVTRIKDSWTAFLEKQMEKEEVKYENNNCTMV